MRNVYLVDGARTPQGRYGGALAQVRPDDLAATVVAESVRRAGMPTDAVDEVILGAANQAGEDNRNVARMAVLLAGLPDAVPGFTVNRLCAGGLTAVATAAAMVGSGAAALVVASEATVREHDLTVRARIVASANAGIAPNVMGLGPVPSTRRALDRAGWAITDLDAVELNEAFAVQSLGVIRQLKLDEEIVNADGGAIALGHPLGCSGARILLTLLGRMERGNHRRGLATLCVGVGQGVSMLVEAP